jgi:hypothetical protein
MHWKLAEYFEAVLVEKTEPEKRRPLVLKLRKEVTEYVKANPEVLAR